MTNTFEGRIFVNSTFETEMTLTQFVTQLFPIFTQAEIEQTVQVYTHVSGLDTVLDQAIAIMGEGMSYHSSLIDYNLIGEIQPYSFALLICFCPSSRTRERCAFLASHMPVKF